MSKSKYKQLSLFNDKPHWSKRKVSFSRLQGGLGLLIVLFLIAQVAIVSWRMGAGSAEIRPVTVSGSSVSTSTAESIYETASPAVGTIIVPEGGSGTGFFFDKGRMLTNFHVIATKTDNVGLLANKEEVEVTVRLSSGKEVAGTVSLFDERLDLAIIDVEGADDITPLSFADPKQSKVGERVVIIGSPFGLENSVSEGILSYISRITDFREDSVQSSLLQTDAAVNPGNSGGPLLNAQSQVLGMVTLRPDQADGRTVEGIAFAIPGNLLMNSVNKLQTTGVVSYAVLGISGSTASGDVKGMLVDSITPDTGAVAAGLEKGDIVTSLDETVVNTYEDVTSYVGSKSPGDTLQVEYVRGTEKRTTSIKLTERAPDAEATQIP